MSFKVIPRLSYTSALSVSASLYFHEPRTSRRTLSFNPLTALEKVEALPLPQNLKKEVLCLLQPVGEEIQAFLEQFWSFLEGHGNYHEKLSWTYLGTIDYGKSAGNFVSSGEWNDLQSFKLACMGSDPEHILRLWPIVKEEALGEISKRDGFRIREVFLKRSDLWFKFWVCHLSLQMEQFKRVNELNEAPADVSKLHIAVMKSNVGAARYFLDDSLAGRIPDLANGYLTRLHRREFDPTTFVFLVNHLNEEDSRAFLNLHSAECLLRCLTWPLLQFVLPMSELVWPRFDFDANIETLLQRVLIKVMQTQEPVAYENIFKSLWAKTPPQYRLMFITNITYHILSNLFLGYDLQQVISEIAKSGHENRIQLLDLFMENANVVMSLSVEDNKYLAFRTILEKYFDDKLIENYEDRYKIFTQDYVNAYYGESISSDNSLSDDFMSDDFISDDLSDSLSDND